MAEYSSFGKDAPYIMFDSMDKEQYLLLLEQACKRIYASHGLELKIKCI